MLANRVTMFTFTNTAIGYEQRCERKIDGLVARLLEMLSDLHPQHLRSDQILDQLKPLLSHWHSISGGRPITNHGWVTAVSLIAAIDAKRRKERASVAGCAPPDDIDAASDDEETASDDEDVASYENPVLRYVNGR